MIKQFVCVHTPNRTFQSQVLGRSVDEFLPEYEFQPLVVKLEPGYHNTMLNVVIARLESTITLLENGAETVVQCGVDYLICSDFSHIDQSYRNSECLLTPHVIRKLPPTMGWSHALLEGGVINSDFQVWRRSRAVVDFLKAWLKKISHPSFNPRNGFEIEQWWLPLCWSMLERPAVIRHPGYGVAYYNLHEREIVADQLGRLIMKDDEIGTNSGMPLVAFHFSGMEFEPESHLLTKYEKGFGRELNGAETMFVTNYREKCALAREAE